MLKQENIGKEAEDKKIKRGHGDFKDNKKHGAHKQRKRNRAVKDWERPIFDMN